MAESCPNCLREQPELLDILPDRRRRFSCPSCDNVWIVGDPQSLEAPSGTSRVRRAAEPYEVALGRFPTVSEVDPAVRERVEKQKRIFLDLYPEPSPTAQAFLTKYQWTFSEEGLADADPADLHLFANSSTVANPGQMTAFNNEWNRIGAEEGARRVRESIQYLLYGPDGIPLEDRLSHLIDPGASLGMKGWKEALLTKTLCVVYPQRFVPILTYTSPNGGKKEIVESMWGLRLPHPRTVSRSTGRLIAWSNDLLLDLAGGGFAHTQHLSQFLWMAKDFDVADNTTRP